MRKISLSEFKEFDERYHPLYVYSSPERHAVRRGAENTHVKMKLLFDEAGVIYSPDLVYFKDSSCGNYISFKNVSALYINKEWEPGYREINIFCGKYEKHVINVSF